MYVCNEPHWKKGLSIIDDRLFLSNSHIMDEMSKMGTEALNGAYNLSDVHYAVALKLKNIFNNDVNYIKFGFDRYVDVEIYRVVIKPEQSKVGHLYGAEKTKGVLDTLLKKIESEENN